MPNEYEEMMGTLQGWRRLRWIDLVGLMKSLLFMFVFVCLTEWKTFHLYGFNLGLVASVRFFGEVLLYGLVVVPCITFAWLLMLRALELNWRKIGFRIGSLLSSHSHFDRAANG